ncbi:DUF4158 domain-containing protein [Frankia sp. CiP3]|uniref:DUF4158 domain-containing protein n=1 Tax=Frankia sp. CiP3 TaxID=2880971 RepID=UPI001EF5AFA3|nr:DUF4158 domain-containing protein [Frankia sp. CiP3]
MSHEYLSSEQVSRYGRFVADPTPEELERFFYLDADTLALAQSKRRLHNRLGWAVQLGTIRMLGMFLTDSDPMGVPEVVIRYMAEQLGIADWSCAKLYPERQQTKYEHAWEIRDLLGYRDFGQAEQEVAAYIASRVQKTRDSRRDLFDRAVVWLVDKRVLLPGITTCYRHPWSGVPLRLVGPGSAAELRLRGCS